MSIKHKIYSFLLLMTYCYQAYPFSNSFTNGILKRGSLPNFIAKLVIFSIFFIIRIMKRKVKYLRLFALKRYKHATTHAESSHNELQIKQLTIMVEQHTSENIAILNKTYYTQETLDTLRHKAASLFITLQNARALQEENALKMICKKSYYNKLRQQNFKIQSYRIKNIIQNIEIKECNLLKIRIYPGGTNPLLTYVIRGAMVNEYILEEDNPETARTRDFSCIFRVSFVYGVLQVVDVNLRRNPNYRIVKEFNRINKSNIYEKHIRQQ